MEQFTVMNTSWRTLKNVKLGCGLELDGGNPPSYARRKSGPFRSFIQIGDMRPGRRFSFWCKAPGIEGRVARTLVWENSK